MLEDARKKREVAFSFPLHSSMMDEVWVHKHVVHSLDKFYGDIVMDNDYVVGFPKRGNVSSQVKSFEYAC